MSNQMPTSRIDQRGTVFDNGVELDIKGNQYPEHMMSPEFLDRAKQEEALVRAAKMAAGNGLASEAVSGSPTTNVEYSAAVLAPEVLADVSRKIGEYLSAVRRQELLGDVSRTKAYKKSDLDLAA